MTYPWDADGVVAEYGGGGGVLVAGESFRGGTRGGTDGPLGFELAEEPELGESRRRTGGGGRLFVDNPVVFTR